MLICEFMLTSRSGSEPHACDDVRTVVMAMVMQMMSFPGSDAQADAPGAEGEDGKAEEEVAPIGSVFAVLQAYATHVFAPTVRAYAASRGGDDKVREENGTLCRWSIYVDSCVEEWQ